MTRAGYSGTSLASKLGIKEHVRLLPVGAPSDYRRLLVPLPTGVRIDRRAGRAVDMAHLFATKQRDLKRRLSRLRASLRPDAAVWVSWPKKAAKVPTDITEDTVREAALPLGYVDVKVCAVTDVWSGLKLVVRKELREHDRSRDQSW